MSENATCETVEPERIPKHQIGVCIGTCMPSNCLDKCDCYSVDADWQPNLQDYATYVFCFINFIASFSFDMKYV